jgi:hypothetical protein
VSDFASTFSRAASAREDGFPLVPIVRTLVDLDAAPAELADAARCAGPAELAFAREIVELQLRSAEERLDAIDDRLDDLRRGLS